MKTFRLISLLSITAILFVLLSCTKDEDIDIINIKNPPIDTTNTNVRNMLIVNVIDFTYQPVKDAKVRIYSNYADWRDNINEVATSISDSAGNTFFKKLLPIDYYIWIDKDIINNAFTTIKTDTILDTSITTTINIMVRPLTQKERILTSDSTKSWIVTQIMTPLGPSPVGTGSVYNYKCNGTYKSNAAIAANGSWSLNEDASIYYYIAEGTTNVNEAPITQLNKFAFIYKMMFMGYEAEFTLEPGK